jgi:hypothetical protein
MDRPICENQAVSYDVAKTMFNRGAHGASLVMKDSLDYRPKNPMASAVWRV